ncbi:MAG: hypothetical protein V4667_00200 [Bacteroidota bacterium]
MTKLLVRFIFAALVFSFSFSFAENTDDLIKNAAQQAKSGKLEKASLTLSKAQKNAKSENEKTQIDEVYQSIIKAYLRDLDYVSAYDVQKKRIKNLEDLYETKAQKKIDALEKKIKSNNKQLEKEKTKEEVKPKENKNKEETKNSNNSLLLWLIIVALLVVLIWVYLQKNKLISTLKNQLNTNSVEPSNTLKTNTTDYKVVELNNKINYLQQQLELKEKNIQTTTEANNKLQRELESLKTELQKVEEKPIAQPVIVETEKTNTSLSLQNYILPRSEFVKHLFGQHFVFNTLANNNSLYWFDSIEGRVYFAIAHYTNNSTTNSELNFILFSLLNRAIHEYGKEKPAEILRQVNANWQEFVGLENEESLIKQEIAMSVCCYNIFNNQLEYAGANNSITIIRDKTPEEKALYVLNADTEYINTKSAEKQFAFTNQVVETKHGDRLFLMNVAIENAQVNNQLQQVFLQHSNSPIAETQAQLNKLSLPETLVIGIDI